MLLSLRNPPLLGPRLICGPRLESFPPRLSCQGLPISQLAIVKACLRHFRDLTSLMHYPVFPRYQHRKLTTVLDLSVTAASAQYSHAVRCVLIFVIPSDPHDCPLSPAVQLRQDENCGIITAG